MVAVHLLSCVRLCDALDWPTGLICPWDFPGKNTGVGCHFLLQGFFLEAGSNLCLLHSQAYSLPLSYLGSLIVCYSFLSGVPPPIHDHFSYDVKSICSSTVVFRIATSSVWEFDINWKISDHWRLLFLLPSWHWGCVIWSEHRWTSGFALWRKNFS